MKSYEAGLSDIQANNIIRRITSAAPAWRQLIEDSFLSRPMKDSYLHLLNNRLERL